MGHGAPERRSVQPAVSLTAARAQGGGIAAADLARGCGRKADDPRGGRMPDGETTFAIGPRTGVERDAGAALGEWRGPR
jgi:hypothetical protein